MMPLSRSRPLRVKFEFWPASEIFSQRAYFMSSERCFLQATNTHRNLFEHEDFKPFCKPVLCKCLLGPTVTIDRGERTMQCKIIATEKKHFDTAEVDSTESITPLSLTLSDVSVTLQFSMTSWGVVCV